jgi:hypothetical protein
MTKHNHTIKLSHEDFIILEYALMRATEVCSSDTRPDHAAQKLREMDAKSRSKLYQISGRMSRTAMNCKKR